MRIIISESQLKSLTEQSKPDYYGILEKHAKKYGREMVPDEVGKRDNGVIGWGESLKLRFWNNGRIKVFNPITPSDGWMGTLKVTGNDTFKIIFDDGDVYDNTTNQIGTPNSTPTTDKPKEENLYVNCASSLDEIKEGSIKILKYGCKNDAVKELQKLLGMEEKYQTGYFGPITKGKVNEFQTSNGLKVDGIVGPKTYAALLQPKTPTDTSGLGVDDDIDQFNKQQTNESIDILKKVFNKLK
jgi:hypothetical protein